MVTPDCLNEIIHQSLHGVEGAADRWKVTFPSDTALLARAAQEWGGGGGHSRRGLMTSYKGGQHPQLEIRVRGAHYLLTGRRLATAIRQALGLPDPHRTPLFTPGADDIISDLLAER